jgi:hypothetical protein
MISDELFIQPAHNASQKPMRINRRDASTLHTSLENRKRETRTNNREQYPRTCNAVDAANHADSAAALKTRKSARRKMRVKHHKKKPPENKHQSRPLLGQE